MNAYTITETIGMYKDFNTRLTKLQEIASKLEKRSSSSSISDQKHTLRKLLQDSDDLERFYKNKEYRNKLISEARYPSFEYAQLEHIHTMSDGKSILDIKDEIHKEEIKIYSEIAKKALLLGLFLPKGALLEYLTYEMDRQDAEDAEKAAKDYTE